MPKQITSLTVFLSCSSELGPDKDVVKSAINEANDILDNSGSTVRFSLWEWKTRAISGISATVQDVIDEQLPEYDVYLGFMWKKFGIPTGKFGSGTEHEFRTSLDGHEKQGSPRYLIFFFKTSIGDLGDIDAEEYLKVQVFKKTVGNLGLLYHTYKDSDEFKTYLLLHLTSIAADWQKQPNVAANKPSEIEIESVEATEVELIPVDEKGFLDYADEFQDLVERGGNLMDAMKEATHQLTHSIEQRGKEALEFAAKFGAAQVPVKISKNLIDQTGDDYLRFSKIVIPLTEELDRCFNTAFDAAVKVVAEARNNVDSDQLEFLKSSMLDLRATILTSKESAQPMVAAYSSMGNATYKFKRGITETKRFVKNFSQMSDQIVSKIDNITRFVDDLLADRTED